MKHNRSVIITIISMRKGEIMREFYSLIIAIIADNKPLRLGEEWSLYLQMAR